MVQIRSKWGVVLVEYKYDAWGNCTVSYVNASHTDLAQSNPIRYRSYYYDTDTGFYYLQSRYYDPQVRRFISADDPGMLGATGTFLSNNLYAYCENNPVNLIDSGGSFGTPIQWVMAAIGGVAGVLFGEFIAEQLGYTSGWKYWAIRGGMVVGGAVVGWFAGTLITKLATTYLIKNPRIILSLASKYGANTVIGVLQFLGINPLLYLDKGLMIGYLNIVFNNPNVFIPNAWVKPLIDLAQQYGFRVDLHSGHPGTNWEIYHLHINKIHIAISEAMIPIIETLLGK